MAAPLSSPNNDPLSGYYGHLTPAQQKALDELKGLLREDGLAIASLDDEAHGDRSHGVSELELLRFLRARRFDTRKAYEMYQAALKWRKSIDLDSLYAEFDWDQARAAARQGYVQYFHKTDRSGSPIHIHELHTIDLNKLFKHITPENQVRYMFLLNESNFRERFPGCTAELRKLAQAQRNGKGKGQVENGGQVTEGSSTCTGPESESESAATTDSNTNGSAAASETVKATGLTTPAETDEELNESEREAFEIREVETVTGILDIRKVGLMGFWKVKDLLGEVIKISDNYYPETSNRLYIINAPSVFSTIWGYIKGWLDARTASRVFILGSDYKQALLEHVAPENLPSHYGGTCTCAGLERGCRNGDVGCWTDYHYQDQQKQKQKQ